MKGGQNKKAKSNLSTSLSDLDLTRDVSSRLQKKSYKLPIRQLVKCQLCDICDIQRLTPSVWTACKEERPASARLRTLHLLDRRAYRLETDRPH